MQNEIAYVLGYIIAILVVLYIIYLISKIGSNRRIGQKWSLFFILMFPIIGLPLILLSPKDKNRINNFNENKSYSLIGTILVFLFIFLVALYGALAMMKQIKFHPLVMSILFGVSGFGYYLTELAEGKSFANIDNE